MQSLFFYYVLTIASFLFFFVYCLSTIVDKTEEMIGSYAAKPDVIEKKASHWIASSAALANPSFIQHDLIFDCFFLSFL